MFGRFRREILRFPLFARRGTTCKWQLLVHNMRHAVRVSVKWTLPEIEFVWTFLSFFPQKSCRIYSGHFHHHLHRVHGLQLIAFRLWWELWSTWRHPTKETVGDAVANVDENQNELNSFVPNWRSWATFVSHLLTHNSMVEKQNK